MKEYVLSELTGAAAKGCPIGGGPCRVVEEENNDNNNAATTPTTAAAASDAAAVLPLAATLTSFSGFGSFHSENIEDLVRLPDAQYKLPASFPVWALTYPADDEVEFLNACADVLDMQDATSAGAANCSNNTGAAAAVATSKAGVAVLSRGLPVRRVRDLSLKQEPAEIAARSRNANSGGNALASQDEQSPASNKNSKTEHGEEEEQQPQYDVIFGDHVSQRHFYTDTDRWVFLNHGAFGGALRGGTLIKHRFEHLMESQPLSWVDRMLLPNIVYCVRRLAAFFRCRPEDLVPASNATLALNAAVSACVRHHTDVVAYLDLEYGSVWKMLREQWNWTRCTMHEIALYPHLVDKDVMGDDQKLTDLLESLLPDELQVFVVDHVTSNSAMLLPVFSHFIPMLRRRGVKYIVVDGAHGAMQYPLDFSSLSEEQLPTVYAGNLHKWMCTPKSAGFMWVHPSMQARMHSPIVTHGARAGMLSEFAWEGTKEYGAFLTIPAVLDFWQRRCGIERLREYCSGLLLSADAMLCAAFGVRSVPRGAPFMRLVPLPRFFHRKIFSAKFLQDALHHVYRCEVPCKDLEDSLYLRVSAFIYNDPNDFERLRDIVLSMRASFRVLFAQFVAQRFESERSKQQLPHHTTSAMKMDDPLVLLQALTDLLAATNDPQSVLSVRPTAEQLRDDSPLPFFDQVLAALELLQSINDEQRRQHAADTTTEAAAAAASSSTAAATTLSASTAATAATGQHDAAEQRENPMLRDAANCSEHKSSNSAGSGVAAPASCGVSAVPLPAIRSSGSVLNLVSTPIAPAPSSGVVINDGTENFGGSLRVQTYQQPPAHPLSIAAAAATATTPIALRSSASMELISALVTKKPCPDSASKGGCGVYGINTMKTTAFTDSSSDSD